MDRPEVSRPELPCHRLRQIDKKIGRDKYDRYTYMYIQNIDRQIKRQVEINMIDIYVYIDIQIKRQGEINMIDIYVYIDRQIKRQVEINMIDIYVYIDRYVQQLFTGWNLSQVL